MSIERRFKRASRRVWSLDQRPADDVLLRLYALYKQATCGDCPDGRGGNGLAARAKRRAWRRHRGMAMVEAMAAYVALVDDLRSVPT